MNRIDIASLIYDSGRSIDKKRVVEGMYGSLTEVDREAEEEALIKRKLLN